MIGLWLAIFYVYGALFTADEIEVPDLEVPDLAVSKVFVDCDLALEGQALDIDDVLILIHDRPLSQIVLYNWGGSSALQDEEGTAQSIADKMTTLNAHLAANEMVANCRVYPQDPDSIYDPNDEESKELWLSSYLTDLGHWDDYDAPKIGKYIAMEGKRLGGSDGFDFPIEDETTPDYDDDYRKYVDCELYSEHKYRNVYQYPGYDPGTYPELSRIIFAQVYGDEREHKELIVPVAQKMNGINDTLTAHKMVTRCSVYRVSPSFFESDKSVKELRIGSGALEFGRWDDYDSPEIREWIALEAEIQSRNDTINVE